MTRIKPASNPPVGSPARRRTAPAPAAPAGLSAAAVGWWKRLHREYDLGDAGALFLLESALRAHDRMAEAGRLVDKHGVAVEDRFGQLRANPAAAAERDARAAMLAAFKALGLDILPPQLPGRPSGR